MARQSPAATASARDGFAPGSEPNDKPSTTAEPKDSRSTRPLGLKEFGWPTRLLAIWVAIGILTPLNQAQHSPEATVTESTTGIALSVNAEDGSYSITVPSPGSPSSQWFFGGSVGQPLSQLAVTTGRDGVGMYQKITFDYSVNGGPRESSLRTYAGRAIVLFGPRSWPPGLTRPFCRASAFTLRD